MPPKPKTINDYKVALLKLKVSLPAKNAKLDEYEKRWTEATATPPAAEVTAAPPSAPRSKRKAPAQANKSPAAQRPRRSSTGGASSASTPVPLSAQATAAGQAHVDRMVSSRASPNMPLGQQRASPNVPLNQQRAPAPARPSPARASPNVPLNQQRVAPARASPARASPNVPLGQQRVAPARPSPARASPNVPLSQQRPAPVPIPLQLQAAVAPAVPWYMPQPAFGAAAPPPLPAFGFGDGAHAPPPAATDAPLPSYSFGGDDDAAAEPAGERAGARARRALACLAPTPRALVSGAAAAAAVGLLATVAALGVPALPALPALLALPALPALPSAGGVEASLRALPQRALHALLQVAASCAASIAHGVWWLLRLLPQLTTRTVAWVWVLPPNEKVGGLVTLAALSFLHRAFVWYERYRHAADADNAKLVDEAVRWAVSELKEQHERWSAVAGVGSPNAMRQAQRLHVSELQRRMPEGCRGARFADVLGGLARLGCRDAGGGSWEWVPTPGAASPFKQGRAPTPHRHS